jgi:hypothetical protein
LRRGWSGEGRDKTRSGNLDAILVIVSFSGLSIGSALGNF